MRFDTNNHSVFILHYHLIMCVKNRNEVINDAVSNRHKEIFEYIAPEYNILLMERNVLVAKLLSHFNRRRHS